MESKPCRVLFHELVALPADVFGPVDFVAFLRLASILRCEDPFDGIVNGCVDALSLVSALVDVGGYDSAEDCSEPPGGKPWFP